MSEYSRRHGKREAPGGGFSLSGWWAGYRAWVSGLDRGGRIRYRLCQVLAVIAVLAAGIVLYLRSWIRLPDVPDVPSLPGVIVSGDSSQGVPDVEYTDAELPDVMLSGRKAGYYTFLVCGQDVVSGATDTMILFTYDTEGKRVEGISLLRDTMINTRASSKRLNTVYARNRGDKDLTARERTENGMAALRQEVSKLTGIYPDYYVLVQWEAIGRLVDAIGGVEFNVPFDMDYYDSTPGQNLRIKQKAGLRLLNGEDAMQVIRFRKNSDGTHILGDAGRTQIQRDFLSAVLKKCLTPEILLKLPTLVEIFTDNVSTDLTVGNILAFAQMAVGMDVESNVKFLSMPYDNTSYRGAALALARQDELLELLNGGLNPYQDEIGADDLQLMYRKSGGGFGVTNAVLADPAVGRSTAGASAPSSSVSVPDGGDSGAVESGSGDSGGAQGGMIEIDPDDIFPEPGSGAPAEPDEPIKPDNGESGGPDEPDTQAAA